jgi:hypothetical protein
LKSVRRTSQRLENFTIAFKERSESSLVRALAFSSLHRG